MLNDPAYSVLPRYWVRASEVDDRLVGTWSRGWLLGWRNITSSMDFRTVIASVVPRVAVGHSMPLMFPSASDPWLFAALYACLSSFVFDYLARQKVAGVNLTYGYLNQLPALPPPTYDSEVPWSEGTTLRNWIRDRTLELTYTAWDLEHFAKDVGWDGPPFRWDQERRFLLRCELDAAFFHLYSIGRNDVDYVMETFPIVRRHDEDAHGEYRTKLTILEVFDAMSEAIRSGKPYRTRLDPPAADPSLTHTPRTSRTK
jgi:hypothetical protein